jgi:uncharacterized radical SAM superfamily Fe-S cluster-containing enzyme
MQVFNADVSRQPQHVLLDDQRSYTRALDEARTRMGHLFTANQILGRSKSIGCTAVEITQRCNLDCTLCYLSDSAEQVNDLPIEEVFRRLDMIKASYGSGTNVQITGGDPTLRKKPNCLKSSVIAVRLA